MAKPKLYEYQYTTPNMQVVKKKLPALKDPKLKSKNKIGMIGSILCMAIGINGGAGILTSYGWMGSVLDIATLIVYILLTVYGVKGFLISRKESGMRERYLEYVEAAAPKGYVDVAKLAERVKKKESQVVDELKEMINNRWFLEGHLDDGNTCFILTHEAYEQYRKAEEARRIREEKEQVQQSIMNDPVQRDLHNLLKEGNDYVRQIHLLNVSIRGEKVSSQLDQIEDISDKILVRVSKRPEKMPDIRKFMRYYLPMTIKVVTAYRDYENHDDRDEEEGTAEAGKREIEETLEKVIEAFGKLYKRLKEEEFLDISTDLDVLEAMMSQEGLISDDITAV